MAKRRKKKSGLEEILGLSWKEQLILAGIAALCAVFFPILGGKSALLRPLTELFGLLAWLATLGLLILALVNFIIHRQKDKNRNPFVSGTVGPERKTQTRVTDQAGPQPTQLAAAWEASIRPIPAGDRIPAKPNKWSLELLRELEWKRFEILCGAYYAKRGFRVETIACGADGGIDAKLFFGKIKDPVGLVQCKAWSTKLVGVKPVRELLGVMAHNKVSRGIFHATGKFSGDALEFARANRIQLIGGTDLIANIGTLPETAQQELLAAAVEGDYKTPTCPSCGIKMRRVSGARGDFWGCSNYPRCKVKWSTAQLPE